jgi:hypothetical protein
MRESMARLTPTFSTNRAVRQYTEEHYLSAAAAFRQRAENRGSAGADLVAWQAELAKHWSALRFGPATVEQQGEQYLFHVQVFLDDIDPDAVSVELYADAQKDGDPITRHDSWRTPGRSDKCLHLQCFCSGQVARLLTTRRASFRSTQERSCRLRLLSFCGTKHRPGDEREAGVVFDGPMASSAAVASESLMFTLSRTLVTVVPPTRSLISPTKSMSVCSAPPRLASASSRPGILTMMGTKYSARLSWKYRSPWRW